MPALLTRPNSPPSPISSLTVAAALPMASASVTSNRSGVKALPNSRWSLAACSSVRTLPKTLKPCRHSSAAVPWPIPVETPVMTMDLMTVDFTQTSPIVHCPSRVLSNDSNSLAQSIAHQAWCIVLLVLLASSTPVPAWEGSRQVGDDKADPRIKLTGICTAELPLFPINRLAGLSCFVLARKP